MQKANEIERLVSHQPSYFLENCRPRSVISGWLKRLASTTLLLFHPLLFLASCSSIATLTEQVLQKIPRGWPPISGLSSPLFQLTSIELRTGDFKRHIEFQPVSRAFSCVPPQGLSSSMGSRTGKLLQVQLCAFDGSVDPVGVAL